MIQIDVLHPPRKWTLWHDDYVGTDWNDRYQYAAGVYTEPEIVHELLGFFVEEAHPFVDIEVDEYSIRATLTYCHNCEKPAETCGCGDTDEDRWAIIGAHAMADGSLW